MFPLLAEIGMIYLMNKDVIKWILIGIVVSTLFFSYYPDSTLFDMKYGTHVLYFDNRESFLNYDVPGVVVNVEHLGINDWTDIYLVSYVNDSMYREYSCMRWGDCKE